MGKMNQIILGSGQFQIKVRNTKTGKEFELPIVTGLFTKNDYDKETFCYVPFIMIMTFLNEKSSDEKVTVMNCGGYHYTGEKIIGVLRHLLNEKIIKRRKNFQPFYFRKCIFC